MNNLKLIESVLLYIDSHLSEIDTYETVASKFNYSSFHFHRIFSAVTGQTITDYINRRRLQTAFISLSETNKTITEICFESGFSSIQTFNRQFKNTFGTLPSIARKKQLKIDFKSVETIITSYIKRVNFIGEYIMEPKFVEKEAFILAGYRKHTKNGWHVIGEVWGELKAIMNSLDRSDVNTMYGFEDYSEDFCSSPLAFYYMAAVEVNSVLNIHPEMHVKKIPKSLYAVFTVNGNNSNGEIGAAFRYIYDVWLPNSEYCLFDEICADFEYYDERWDCQSSCSQIDLYIPIKKLTD